MARPQRAPQLLRRGLPLVKPKRFRSYQEQRRAESASTWFPLIAVVTFLVLTPFLLVRLAEWFITH